MPLIGKESASPHDHHNVTAALLSSESVDEDQEAAFGVGDQDGEGLSPQLLIRNEWDGSNVQASGDKQTELLELRPSEKKQEEINRGPTNTAIKTLEWLTCPVTTVEEDAVLPPISVFSQPEITDEVELVVHSNGEGTAQVAGQRRVSLRSQGSHKPSVGTFEDIRIKRAGLYVIEVRSVRNPEISLVADHPTDVVTKIISHNPLSDTQVPEEYGLGKSVWTEYAQLS